MACSLIRGVALLRGRPPDDGLMPLMPFLPAPMPVTDGVSVAAWQTDTALRVVDDATRLHQARVLRPSPCTLRAVAATELGLDCGNGELHRRAVADDGRARRPLRPPDRRPARTDVPRPIPGGLARPTRRHDASVLPAARLAPSAAQPGGSREGAARRRPVRLSPTPAVDQPRPRDPAAHLREDGIQDARPVHVRPDPRPDRALRGVDGQQEDLHLRVSLTHHPQHPRAVPGR